MQKQQPDFEKLERQRSYIPKPSSSQQRQEQREENEESRVFFNPTINRQSTLSNPFLLRDNDSFIVEQQQNPMDRRNKQKEKELLREFEEFIDPKEEANRQFMKERQLMMRNPKYIMNKEQLMKDKINLELFMETEAYKEIKNSLIERTIFIEDSSIPYLYELFPRVYGIQLKDAIEMVDIYGYSDYLEDKTGIANIYFLFINIMTREYMRGNRNVCNSYLITLIYYVLRTGNDEGELLRYLKIPFGNLSDFVDAVKYSSPYYLYEYIGVEDPLMFDVISIVISKQIKKDNMMILEEPYDSVLKDIYTLYFIFDPENGLKLLNEYRGGFLPTMDMIKQKDYKAIRSLLDYGTDLKEFFVELSMDKEISPKDILTIQKDLINNNKYLYRSLGYSSKDEALLDFEKQYERREFWNELLLKRNIKQATLLYKKEFLSPDDIRNIQMILKGKEPRDSKWSNIYKISKREDVRQFLQRIMSNAITSRL